MLIEVKLVLVWDFQIRHYAFHAAKLWEVKVGGMKKDKKLGRRHYIGKRGSTSIFLDLKL